MLTILLLLAALAGDPKPSVNVSGTLALNGYDAVAYVTDGKPVRGLPQLSSSWNGAVWRFTSAEHRDAFLKDPERYAPQFGGYCAWAVAHGYTANGDPEVWTIVDGKLYLNYSRRVQKRWEADIRGYIVKGQANWPDVLRK
jgi:YHS domain-containing protein